MNQTSVDAGTPSGLRALARQRLSAGIAPPSRGWGVSVEALALLHRLASDPDSAADALKLLHELQVHQVELDLQQAQLEVSERELSETLARYQGLHTLAPLAYFVLDSQGRVQECSPAAAKLLAAASEDVCGRPFRELLRTASRAQFGALLEALIHDGANAVEAEVQAANTPDGARHWQIRLCRVSTSGDILLVATPGTESSAG
ncbi:MAG: PAS domain-containing protein [Aquimonas sp.]|nr:PAS domain-containing protein [Aquimonas sp.]